MSADVGIGHQFNIDIYILVIQHRIQNFTKYQRFMSYVPAGIMF